MSTREEEIRTKSSAPTWEAGCKWGPERLLQARALLLDAARYGAVSFIALAADAGLLRVLVLVAGWHYLPASTVSFIAGATIAYVLSIHFVFHHRQVDSRVLEFGYFVGLGLVGLLVNALVLSIAIGILGLGLMVAKSTAAMATFATNFLLRRALLFSPSRGMP